MAKQKSTIYKKALKLNAENCQDHQMGFSDSYFKRLVDWIIDESRTK